MSDQRSHDRRLPPELQIAAGLGLNSLQDIHRYAQFQQPAWSAPIPLWLELLQVTSTELLSIEGFALELRGFAGLCVGRTSDLSGIWGAEAGAEADRLMRYLDVRAAFGEAAALVIGMAPSMRANLIAGPGQPETPAGRAELARVIAKRFLTEAEGTYLSAAERNRSKGVEGVPPTWDQAVPEVRRGILAAVRANTSFEPG
jgi:hypothetical protein